MKTTALIPDFEIVESRVIPTSNWHLSHRADSRALPLADRHYNRQKVGSPQFLPPGRCFALLTAGADALWATSFPFAQYVRHAWAGAWMNSLFRNESTVLSSDLIREAVAITRWYHATNPKWASEPEPTLGMVTFVDAKKTKRKRDPGRCYRKAGFKHVGYTKGGLWALQLLPADMPEPLTTSGWFPTEAEVKTLSEHDTTPKHDQDPQRSPSATRGGG